MTYAYYGTGDAAGSAGDLALVTTVTATGDVEGSYMRYYTSDTGNGYTNALEYLVTNDSYLRMLANNSLNSSTVTVSGLSALSDSTVAAFADLYYQYDSAHRVTQLTSQRCRLFDLLGRAGSTTTFDYSVKR